MAGWRGPEGRGSWIEEVSLVQSLNPSVSSWSLFCHSLSSPLSTPREASKESTEYFLESQSMCLVPKAGCAYVLWFSLGICLSAVC